MTEELNKVCDLTENAQVETTRNLREESIVYAGNVETDHAESAGQQYERNDMGYNDRLSQDSEEDIYYQILTPDTAQDHLIRNRNTGGVRLFRRKYCMKLIFFAIGITIMIAVGLATYFSITSAHSTDNPLSTTTPDVPATPLECLAASNLTDFWRKDHNGSNFKPGGPSSVNGYACDLRHTLQWFRIAGNAGQRLLNFCPVRKSCGTYYPIWSNTIIPKEIGTIFDIKFNSMYKEKCNTRHLHGHAMRCSDKEYDIIYKYSGKYLDECVDAFCTM